MVRHTGKDFIDEESVAVTPVFSFQSACINGTEFDAPQPDRFSANGDASLGQEVLNIAMAQVEFVVEPDRVRNDIWWESVSFIGIHPPILAIMET
jgi:hypothetical protein